MADPVTWREVVLALSGAPVGALIAVAGVQLTNRHNEKSQQALISAQANQHRAQLEFDLRASLQQETLRTRSELYEGVLSQCERTIELAEWANGNAVAADRGPLTNEDLLSFWLEVRRLRFRIMVHCSAGATPDEWVGLAQDFLRLMRERGRT